MSTKDTRTCTRCGAPNRPVTFHSSPTLETLRQYADAVTEGHAPSCRALLHKAIDDGLKGIVYVAKARPHLRLA